MRRLIAAVALALGATVLVGVAPANAVGNKKCDTNSPQWDVDMCLRTNAYRQTDGTGYRMSNIRVWSEGDNSTLEDCSSWVATVILRKADGTAIDTRAGNGCAPEYSHTFDFGDVKFGAGAYVVLDFKMYDNGDPDPKPGRVTMDAVS